MTDQGHREYRAALLKLFAGIDPVGLIKSGAPRDEYAPEIDELVRWRTPVTADQVKATFIKWFGEPTGQLSDDDATRLAEGIVHLRASAPTSTRLGETRLVSGRSGRSVSEERRCSNASAGP